MIFKQGAFSSNNSKLKWRNWPLAVKLTLTMTFLVVMAVGSVTLLAIRREQEAFRTELQQQANLLLAVLTAAAADPLYTLDADALSDMVETLGSQALGTDRQILASGRIYDANGRVVGDAYDPLAVFTLEPDPLGQQLVNSNTTFFDWQPDQLVAGRAVIVGNQRLGAVSVGLPTASLQAKLAAVRNRGLGVALATASVGILLALLLSRSITGPLQRLVEATRRIAAGDLTQAITTDSDDELAALGQAMEQMRVELRRLHQDLAQQVVWHTQAWQESEVRFRQAIDSISDHIYMAEFTEDKRWVNHYISPNVETLTGYPPQAFIADSDLWPSLIHADDRAIAQAQFKRLLQGQSSETEYRLNLANGKTIWVRDSAQAERDSGQIKIYGIIGDITERKQTEEVLASARDRALEASRLKTELLAKVSHELRTPLNAILGFAEMLQMGVYGPISAEQQRPTGQIIDSVDYLTDLVNELLDQAQLDAGKIKLNITPIAPATIVSQVYSQMKILAQAKGLALTVEVADNMPLTLKGDLARLQQILTNLVSNAIKFTETGTVEINVYQPDADHWAMGVIDTGPGIPAEAHTRIFEPFGQVDGSMTRQHSGAGLGLSIVRQLTTLMRGEIELKSEINQGSLFTVILPLDQG